MGVELPVSAAFPVCQPARDHGRHCHAPGQESGPYPPSGQAGRGHPDPAFWIGAQSECSLPHAVSRRCVCRAIPRQRVHPADATSYLERQGLLERDVENSYLASDAVDDDPMTLGHSITYRIAVGSQAGRKVFTLQTLPTSGDPFGDGIGTNHWISLQGWPPWYRSPEST